jgi:hypothetical protein
MKRTILSLATAAIAIIPTMAAAQVVDDPLHGSFCVTSACTSFSSPDNGIVTPATSVQLENGFGWTFSGSGTGAGDLIIAVLVPTSITIASVPTGISGVQGTSLGSGNIVDHAGVFSSGDLATFLGLPNSSPANPIGGFEVQTDASATGFNVFTIDVGQIQASGPGAALTDIFRFAGLLPVGSEVVGFLTSGTGASASTVATAPSGDLQVQAVPAPLVGAGLPGLIAGALGLVGLARRRRQLRVGA